MLIKSLSFMLLLSALFGAMANAATYTAATCNASDVQAKITAASDGDTVVIPNGDCTWTTGISTSKQIKIQGQTKGRVILRLNANTTLFHLTTGSSYHTEISNLNFYAGSYCLGYPQQCNTSGFYIVIDGGGQVPLMHDNYFWVPNYQILNAVKWNVTGGVIWSNTFENTEDTGCSPGFVGSDSGSLVLNSNYPWDNASTMGALDTNGTINTYIEDNIFNEVGQMPDVAENARVVARHNQFIGTSGLTHGPTGPWGGRQLELYDNTFTFPNTNRALSRYFWFRSGTAVITDNSFQKITGQCYGARPSVQFIVESASRATPHRCCTGGMCWHQPGSGASGTDGNSYLSTSQTDYDGNYLPHGPYQVPDPIYIWNNTGTGASAADLTSMNDSDLTCNTGNTTSTFFQSGRHYYVNTSGGGAGAKPGYTKYNANNTYPHPLRLTSGTATAAPPAPTGLQAVIQ